MTPLDVGQKSVPREGESINGPRAKPDYKIDETTGCWVWQKALSRRGYPTQQEYRTYWALANGPIPPAHDVHHLCKNTACVNPDHLEAIHERAHDVHHFLGERANGLTLEDIRQIRELGKTNATMGEVAAIYGLNPYTVRDYWRGRRWAKEFGGEVRPQNRKCAECGTPIDPSKQRGTKFCSMSCCGAFNYRKAGSDA